MIKLKTWQKCRCGANFKRIGDDLICLSCGIRPTKVYLRWFYNGEEFTSKPSGDIRETVRLGCEIESQITGFRFKPEMWKGDSRNAIQKFTFEFVYDKWLERRGKDLERSKIAPGYMKSLKQYRKKYLAHEWPQDIRQIKTYHVRQFADSLPAGMSLKTQKNIMMVLQVFFRNLHEDSLISDMPVFPKYEIEEKLIPWIDRATQQNIMQHIPDADKPVFRFMMATGLRPSETMALKWKDVDREAGCIHIRAGISVGAYREITKTKKQWDTPITRAVKGILDELKRNLCTEHLFWYVDSKGRFYKRYGEKKLRAVWNKACFESGVGGVNLYAGTRHSFASQNVNNGVALTDIGAMMGHTSTETTKKYAHIDKLKRLKEIFD